MHKITASSQPAQEPIVLMVKTINISNEYVPPLTTPHIEHVFPIEPANLIQKWVTDNLRIMGGLYKARVRILDASVITSPIKIEKSWKTIFRDSLSQKYTATLKTRIEVFNPENQAVISWVEAGSTTSVALPKSASIKDREAAYASLLDTAMAALDQEIRTQVHTYFKTYIISQ